MFAAAEKLQRGRSSIVGKHDGDNGVRLSANEEDRNTQTVYNVAVMHSTVTRCSN